MGHLSIGLAATNIAPRSACGDFAVWAPSSKSSSSSFDIFLAISGVLANEDSHCEWPNRAHVAKHESTAAIGSIKASTAGTRLRCAQAILEGCASEITIFPLLKERTFWSSFAAATMIKRHRRKTLRDAVSHRTHDDIGLANRFLPPVATAFNKRAPLDARIIG